MTTATDSSTPDVARFGSYLTRALERQYGALERPEIKAQLEDRILTLCPTVSQAQADLFVNYALTVTHGEGPNQAVTDMLAGLQPLLEEPGEVDAFEVLFAGLCAA